MNDWLDPFYQASSLAAVEDRHVGALIDVIIREYEQRRDALDMSLNAIDLPRLEEILLLAIIRSLYPVRKTLSNWTGLRDRMRSDFKRRGLDHDELLQGL